VPLAFGVMFPQTALAAQPASGPFLRALKVVAVMVRKCGRVVEGTSLENWRARKGTVGSNPTASAMCCSRFRDLASDVPGLWYCPLV
jgi:hypothetical protein